MKKPFKETQVGKFLRSKGFDYVMDAVGEVVPGVAILAKVKDMVLGPDKKISLTPEDQAHFLELMEAEQKHLDAVLADTANARSRQVELAKAGGKDMMHSVVTGFFLVCFGVILVQKLFFPTPETAAMNDVEMTLRDICFMIATFYFGSSLGSRMKTKILTPKDE